jgi:hypothetical protein
MNCNNCNKEIPASSKFCVYCGSKTEPLADSPVEQKKVIENKGVLSKIADYGVSAIAFGIGYAFGWIMLLVIIVPFLVGSWFAKWYGSRAGNTSIVNVIAWANIATWFLPVLGYFTAGAAIKFSDLKTGKERKKLLILGSIGLVLSLVNSIVGVLT